MGHPDPVTNRMDAHNTWVVSQWTCLRAPACANMMKADAEKDYIAWVAKQGYAVIDVNIPKHITREPVRLGCCHTSHRSPLIP